MPLIRCLTPFPGGTKLVHQGRSYHFLPNEQNHFVADVLDKDVSGVLSIGAGYQAYNPDDYASIAQQDEMVPDYSRKTTVNEGGTTVEVNREYLLPASRAPKDDGGKPNRTDQHKQRVADGKK